MTLIAFRHHDTRLFARIVCALRGGDSAHVEAAQPVGTLALCVSASWIDGGARGKVIDIRDAAKWRVYRIDTVIDPTAWLQAHYGERYDWLGLLGIELPPLGHDRGRPFCCEAIAQMLGLDEPHTYDLVRLERWVQQHGTRVAWADGAWEAA